MAEKEKPYHRQAFKSSAFFSSRKSDDCILCCAFFPFQDSQSGTLKYYDIGHEKTDSTYYHASTRTLSADKAWEEIREFEHENSKIYAVVDPGGKYGHLLPDECRDIAHVLKLMPEAFSFQAKFSQAAADKRTEALLQKIEQARKSGPRRLKP